MVKVIMLGTVWKNITKNRNSQENILMQETNNSAVPLIYFVSKCNVGLTHIYTTFCIILSGFQNYNRTIHNNPTLPSWYWWWFPKLNQLSSLARPHVPHFGIHPRLWIWY